MERSIAVAFDGFRLLAGNRRIEACPRAGNQQPKELADRDEVSSNEAKSEYAITAVHPPEDTESGTGAQATRNKSGGQLHIQRRIDDMNDAGAERDDGQDKTDKQADMRLAKKAVKQTAQMPFYESEPSIYFIADPDKEDN